MTLCEATAPVSANDIGVYTKSIQHLTFSNYRGCCHSENFWLFARFVIKLLHENKTVVEDEKSALNGLQQWNQKEKICTFIILV